jgi:hypothetical protein
MYYYFVSGLPLLTFGEKPPFTSDRYLFSSQGVLTKEHEQELRMILAGRASDGKTEFSRTWYSIDTQIRNAIAHFRGTRLGVESKPFIRSYGPHSVLVQNKVSAAFMKTNPLERERSLDLCRWQMLDELTLQDPFGLSAVLAYGIKLQILERWAAHSDEAGRARVEAILSEVS